jgi:hypothetical protein
MIDAPRKRVLVSTEEEAGEIPRLPRSRSNSVRPMDAPKVWQRVVKFANARLADGRPVFTTEKGVRNFITDVKPGSIGRRSDDGITNSSRVTRGEVVKLWAELTGGPSANVLYFTRALVVAALPDLVEEADGNLRVKPSLKRLKILDGGEPIDATFSIETNDTGIIVILESRGGTKGTAQARNTEYARGLFLLLVRIGQIEGILEDALVDSTEARRLAVDKRRLDIDGFAYPVALDTMHDVNALRRAIMRAAPKVGRDPKQSKGAGNPSKRLRFVVTIPDDQRSRVNDVLTGRAPDEVPVEDLLGKKPRGRRSSQGFIQDPVLRKQLEMYGMERAEVHFRSLGYDVDPSAHKSNPFDMLCTKQTEKLHVEVKATTTLGDEIRLTPNEVTFARTNKARMALCVVHSIVAARGQNGFELSGGQTLVRHPWDIDAGELTPIMFFWSADEDS